MSKLTQRELIQAVKTLALFVRRDLSLQDAVKAVSDKNEAWVQVRQDLKQGDELSGSLQRYPQVFSPFFSGLVKSAEQSNRGEQILLSLSECLERAEQARDEIENMLRYPVILLGFLLLELALLLNWGFPEVVLPLVYSNSPTMPDTSFYKIAALVSFFLGISCFFMGKKVRYLFPVVQVFPQFRSCLERSDASLWARAVAANLQGGQALPEALDRCADLVWSTDLAQELGPLGEKIREGDSLSQALADCDLVDPQLKWAVTAGEAKEDLSATLLFAAERLERDLQHRSRAFFTFLQPVAILLLGLLTLTVIAPFWWMLYSSGWNLGL